MQQLCDMVEIDAALLIEHDCERISRTGDHGRRRRGNHPLAEDRAGAGGVSIEIVVFDRGNKPAIGIVEKGREVRTAVCLADLAGRLVL